MERCMMEIQRTKLNTVNENPFPAVSLRLRHAAYQQHTGTNWPGDVSLTLQTEKTALAARSSAGLLPRDWGVRTLDRTAGSFPVTGVQWRE